MQRSFTKSGVRKLYLLQQEMGFLCGVLVPICQTFGRASFAIRSLALMRTIKTRRWLLCFIVNFVGLILAHGVPSPMEDFWNLLSKESEACVQQ